MARHRIGDKPLSAPLLTRFTDIYAAPWGDALNTVDINKTKQITNISIYLYTQHIWAEKHKQSNSDL